MTKWHIYNEAGVFNGKSLDCPNAHLDQNVPDGYGCFMGEVDYLSQRINIETGLLVDYQPHCPSVNHQWDIEKKRWVYIPPIEEIKACKNTEITQAKINANRSYFVFDEKQISVSESDMREMQCVNGYVLLNNTMPVGWPGGWKAIDNSYVYIPDKAAWVSFWNAMTDAGTSNFNRSQLLKSAIANATTVEEVKAINWDTQI